MTDNIWTSYAERRPTKEDADYDACVFYLWSNGRVERAWWALSFNETPPDSWARTADVLRATGYVKPRKLHSAWRELKEDSWEGTRFVWVVRRDLQGGAQTGAGPEPRSLLRTELPTGSPATRLRYGRTRRE